MSGIYIHIPFCRKACHYCNFHFSTNLSLKDRMVEAIVTELKNRKDYLQEGFVSSIYFGGGTPSLLAPDQVRLILETAAKYYSLSDELEVTLEANPEDINPAYLKHLAAIGINRLSIGVQSFHEADLGFMNRAHDRRQSLNSLELIKSSDIDQLCVDLMFGLVYSDMSKWIDNMENLLKFRPDHISCYNLTIEEQTAFAHWKRQGKIKEIAEDAQYDQFISAHQYLGSAGYSHYEISNYCLPERESRHNSNYWSHGQYIGIGPGAHSFDGSSRQWNISNNALYLTTIESGQPQAEKEDLSQVDLYNEYIMLNLRRSKGIKNNELSRFDQFIIDHFHEKAEMLIDQNLLHRYNDSFQLTIKDWYRSDAISSELFMIE